MFKVNDHCPPREIRRVFSIKKTTGYNLKRGFLIMGFSYPMDDCWQRPISSYKTRTKTLLMSTITLLVLRTM